MMHRFHSVPSFVRGLFIWQLSAISGSVLTVGIWIVAQRAPSDLAAVGSYILMSWAISSLLSTPAALAIFVSAVRTRPDKMRQRIIQTHDIGAILTMFMLFTFLTIQAGGLPANLSGLFEPVVIAFAYPTFGGFIWRQFLARIP